MRSERSGRTVFDTWTPTRNGHGLVREALLLVVLWLPIKPVTATPPQPAPRDRADIVSILSSTVATRADRERAWAAVDRLDDTARDATLRDLVTLARESYAVSAAHVLIYSGASSIDTLIADRIVSWSDESRTSVLRAIMLAERVGELTQIPRRLLRHVVERAAPADDPGSAVDAAAVLLAASGDRAAAPLLARAAPLVARSRGVWLGLAMCGGVAPAELPIALSVQVDGRLPVLVRATAAVAVAPHLDESGRFAETWILEYVRRFGPMPLTTIAATLGADDESQRRMYDEFWTDLRLVALLRYLQSDGALEVTMEALETDNEAIRQTAAAVLVERWPQTLLKHGPGRLDEAEHAALLVLLARRHPAHRATIKTQLETAQLDAARDRLHEFGEMGLLEWAGPVMAGF